MAQSKINVNGVELTLSTAIPDNHVVVTESSDKVKWDALIAEAMAANPGMRKPRHQNRCIVQGEITEAIKADYQAAASLIDNYVPAIITDVNRANDPNAPTDSVVFEILEGDNKGKTGSAALNKADAVEGNYLLVWNQKEGLVMPFNAGGGVNAYSKYYLVVTGPSWRIKSGKSRTQEEMAEYFSGSKRRQASLDKARSDAELLAAAEIYQAKTSKAAVKKLESMAEPTEEDVDAYLASFIPSRTRSAINA